MSFQTRLLAPRSGVWVQRTRTHREVYQVFRALLPFQRDFLAPLPVSKRAALASALPGIYGLRPCPPCFWVLFFSLIFARLLHGPSHPLWLTCSPKCPPLEPPAEGADEVYRSPLRCWAGKSGGSRRNSCRSNPSTYLPTYLPTDRPTDLPTYLPTDPGASMVPGSFVPSRSRALRFGGTRIPAKAEAEVPSSKDHRAAPRTAQRISSTKNAAFCTQALVPEESATGTAEHPEREEMYVDVLRFLESLWSS